MTIGHQLQSPCPCHTQVILHMVGLLLHGLPNVLCRPYAVSVRYSVMYNPCLGCLRMSRASGGVFLFVMCLLHWSAMRQAHGLS